jgi:hypothetical protein
MRLQVLVLKFHYMSVLSFPAIRTLRIKQSKKKGPLTVTTVSARAYHAPNSLLSAIEDATGHVTPRLHLER